MICHEIQQELSAWIDDELSLEMRASVGAHLSFCASCRKALTELEATIALLHADPEPTAPTWITDAAMQLMRQRTQRRAQSIRARIRRVLFEPLWPKVAFEGLALATTAAIAALTIISFGNGEVAPSHPSPASKSPASEEIATVPANSSVQGSGRMGGRALSFAERFGNGENQAIDDSGSSKAPAGSHELGKTSGAWTMPPATAQIAIRLEVEDANDAARRLEPVIRSLDGEQSLSERPSSGNAKELIIGARVPRASSQTLLTRLSDIGVGQITRITPSNEHLPADIQFEIRISQVR